MIDILSILDSAIDDLAAAAGADSACSAHDENLTCTATCTTNPLSRNKKPPLHVVHVEKARFEGCTNPESEIRESCKPVAAEVGAAREGPIIQETRAVCALLEIPKDSYGVFSARNDRGHVHCGAPHSANCHDFCGSPSARESDLPRALQSVLQDAECQTLGAPDADDGEERAALIAEGAGVPRAWAEGFAALGAMPPPTGFMLARWQRIVDATGAFLDHWAAEAIRCGWTDLDVFGVDRNAPTARFDSMGLVLLLDHCEVVGIDPEGADVMTPSGARQRFYRRPLPLGTVSLWELASGDDRA